MRHIQNRPGMIVFVRREKQIDINVRVCGTHSYDPKCKMHTIAYLFISTISICRCDSSWVRSHSFIRQAEAVQVDIAICNKFYMHITHWRVSTKRFCHSRMGHVSHHSAISRRPDTHYYYYYYRMRWRVCVCIGCCEWGKCGPDKRHSIYL